VKAALERLVERATNGDMRALARLLTIAEAPGEASAALLDLVTPRAGRAHVIGFTGIPGAGKSTLVGKVVRALRGRGYRVAVIAIDPSSPYSGGSIMGDRLRMQDLASDPGVFIRSIPTRGLKGGLSMAALSMIEVFDAAGYDKIIVETVGVGQSEVDIASAADTIVVVTMPGAGDDIQALKAGVMEIGDIYVVNKSDKPEANKTAAYLQFALEKEDIGAGAGWKPILVKTSAVLGQGIEQLVDALEKHWEYIKTAGVHGERVSRRRLLLARLHAEALLSRAVGELMEEWRESLEDAARKGRGLHSLSYRLAREAARRLAAWEAS